MRSEASPKFAYRRCTTEEWIEYSHPLKREDINAVLECLPISKSGSYEVRWPDGRSLFVEVSAKPQL